MHIERLIRNKIISNFKSGKVTLIVGARRVGKTYLLEQIIKTANEEHLLLNGEDIAVHDLLKRRSVQNYKNILGDSTLLVIDEAQKIPDIGNILKLIVDSFSELKIIVTGSSAFDIFNRTGEPLTGRKITYQLFPIAESEIKIFESSVESRDNLEQRLIFGNYPELFHLKNQKEKSEYLRDIINSYLLKDILVFESVKNSSKLFDLLKLIAFQVGAEVSYEELGKQLAIHKNTVERYLDLLSKVYVLHKLTGFSRNLRKEIVKKPKWYFYDNGIRNSIIANHNSLENRNDVGALWENYMISERIKYQNYNSVISNNYFWRTYDRQEIDLVEDRGGNLFAYEFKWSSNKIKIPVSWKKTYPDAKFKQITNQNYSEFLNI